MAFKMMGGKSPKAKTGNGVPSSLMGGPKMHGDSHTDPVDAKKAKDKDKKPRPVKASVNSTTEDLGRGARRTTIKTTSEFGKTKGKDLGPGYKPSKAETAKANKQKKLKNESKTIVRTSKGVKDVASFAPSTELMKRRKKPVKASNGFYSKGSNEANKSFGGRSTSTYSKKPHVGDKSYTVSPSNPKSGKPNTFKTRELTDREAKVQQSKFSNKDANPFDTTKSQWNKYLTGVENAEAKNQTKVVARNKVKATMTADLNSKKAALKIKQDSKRARMEAFKKSKKK